MPGNIRTAHVASHYSARALIICRLAQRTKTPTRNRGIIRPRLASRAYGRNFAHGAQRALYTKLLPSRCRVVSSQDSDSTRNLVARLCTNFVLILSRIRSNGESGKGTCRVVTGNIRTAHVASHYSARALIICRLARRKTIMVHRRTSCVSCDFGRRSPLPAPALGWGRRSPPASAFAMRVVSSLVLLACSSRALPSRRPCGGRSATARGGLAPGRRHPAPCRLLAHAAASRLLSLRSGTAVSLSLL